jgi:hypothetical protein
MGQLHAVKAKGPLMAIVASCTNAEKQIVKSWKPTLDHLRSSRAIKRDPLMAPNSTLNCLTNPPVGAVGHRPCGDWPKGPLQSLKAAWAKAFP